MQNNRARTARRRQFRAAAWVAPLITLALLVAACGSDTGTSATTETNDASAATPAPEAPTTTAVPGPTDEELATSALLVAEDLGDGWTDGAPELLFPYSVELASTVPECADFAELVFPGGADHGVGVDGVLSREADVLFTYAVVFPTDEDAAAMVAATADPDFDACWARFNEVSVLEMPFGVTSATYEPVTPPDLKLTADSFNLEHVAGSVEIGGSALADSCVCVFAQSGRGVIEVHSTEATLDPAERTEVAQIAIDKLAEILADE